MKDQKNRVQNDRSPRLIFLRVGRAPTRLVEKLAVPACLNRKKDTVNDQRKKDQASCVKRGKHSVSSGSCEVWKNEGDEGKRENEAEKGIHSLEVEILFPESDSAGEEGDAQESPQDHHHDGEHGVAGECWIVPIEH
jgi:hypothetical protein